MDTMGAVAFVAAVLLIVTFVLNAITLIVTEQQIRMSNYIESFF